MQCFKLVGFICGGLGDSDLNLQCVYYSHNISSEPVKICKHITATFLPQVIPPDFIVLKIYLKHIPFS